MKTEIPMKQWLSDEAHRLRTTPRGVYMRYRRGGYPRLKLRRINKRVILVLTSGGDGAISAV